MNKKFEYFLNAVHYCMWRRKIKQHSFAQNIIHPVLSRIVKYITTKEYQEKFFSRQAIELNKYNKWRVDSQNSIHIAEANHWFGYTYSCYTGIFGYMLFALGLHFNLGFNVWNILLLIFPIAIGYIPAYKAVFSKDRYLEYFKQFKKEDEQWHKKWNRITTVFCIGAIILFFAGPLTGIALFILLD